MTDLLFAHTDRETFIVRGADRLSWLNGLVTCDVGSLSAGQATWGLSLSSTGKIQSDLWVLAMPDQLLVAVASGIVEKLVSTLDKMLIMEDAELLDASGKYEWLTLHGPSAQLLAPRVAIATGALAYGTIDLVTPNEVVLAAARGAVERRVAVHGSVLGSEVVLGSADDWDAFRIEGGLPLFGVDYDSRHNPHDASLERRAVSWSKGCYLGQEVVCMQDLRGKAKRRLLPLVIDRVDSATPGTPVTDGTTGERVGEITSSVFSRQLKMPVAIAAIKAGYEKNPELLVQGNRARLLSPH